MASSAKDSRPTGPPARADALAGIVLRDQDGADVRLGDLWRHSPAALVWLRHYGWVHCRHHAVQLHRAQPEFEAAGVPLVLIGQATPRHAAHFRRRLEIDLSILADADRSTYKAAGARMGSVGALLGPRSVAAGVGRTVGSRGRIHQGRPIGHVAQLGGAMVIAPDGSVAWAYMSKDASDNPSAEELLAAARSAAASTAQGSTEG